MALKACNNLLRSSCKLSSLKFIRQSSQFYAVDDIVFGLNDEQKQVRILETNLC